MKRFQIILIALLVCVSLLWNCSPSSSGSLPDAPPGSQQLSISSISSDHGVYNDTIVINGTGFSSILSQNLFYFNGKAATIISASLSQIKVLVPLKAGTGKVSVNVNGISADGPIFTYQVSPVLVTIAGTGYPGTANGQSTSASFATPTGIAADLLGNIYVADLGEYAVRKINKVTVVTTFAGIPGVQGTTDGAGSTALFARPYGITTDKNGDVYVADFDNSSIRKITTDGVVSTVVGHASNYLIARPTGVATDANGNLFVIGPNTDYVLKVAPDGTVTVYAGNMGSSGSEDGPASAATFNTVFGLAIDHVGNIFLAEKGNNLIRKISYDGIVTTIAGQVHVTGSADGIGAAASFNSPRAIAVDSKGVLYVADQGNNSIRKITPDGLVSTYIKHVSDYAVDGGGFYLGPFGLTVNINDELIILNTGENRVQKVIVQ